MHTKSRTVLDFVGKSTCCVCRVGEDVRQGHDGVLQRAQDGLVRKEAAVALQHDDLAAGQGALPAGQRRQQGLCHRGAGAVAVPAAGGGSSVTGLCSRNMWDALLTCGVAVQFPCSLTSLPPTAAAAHQS